MDVSINQQVRELLNLRRLPARLTMPQTAAVLNCREHDIQVLVAKGLLHGAHWYFGKAAVNEKPHHMAAGLLLLLAAVCGTVKLIITG